MASKSVLLDADVLIHFYKGDKLGLLPDIVNPLRLCLLEKVYKELKYGVKSYVDQMITYKLISEKSIEEDNNIYLETIKLSSKLGIGESACLAYARFKNEVIASSNLSDIAEYCNSHQIDYMTTMDLLVIALDKKIMTAKECNQFITKVRSRKSNILVVEIKHYRQSNPSKIHLLDE